MFCEINCISLSECDKPLLIINWIKHKIYIHNKCIDNQFEIITHYRVVPFSNKFKTFCHIYSVTIILFAVRSDKNIFALWTSLWQRYIYLYKGVVFHF